MKQSVPPSDDTIFHLIERSIAKGSLMQGSTANLYAFDDPAFDDYILKVMKDALTSDGKLVSTITPNTRIYPLRTGFTQAHVGQVLFSQEDKRLFFILEKVKGNPLEYELKKHLDKKGSYAGVLAFLDDLIGMPERGVKDFFLDLLQATRLNCGLDLYGGGNILTDNTALYPIDMDVMLKHYFDPKQFNHVDAIFSHICCLVDNALSDPSQEQRQNIDRKKEILRKKLLHVADKVGFPKNAEEVERWMQQQRFISRGVLSINPLAVKLEEKSDRLLAALARTQSFLHAVDGAITRDRR